MKYAVHWNLVLDTDATTTALKVLERVAHRLDAPLDDVWIRRWGEDRSRHSATFRTRYESHDVAGSMVADLLRQGGAISATWIVDMSPAGTILEMWTPREYRKFKLAGISAASISVNLIDDALPETPGGGNVRCVVIADHTVVNVVS